MTTAACAALCFAVPPALHAQGQTSPDVVYAPDAGPHHLTLVQWSGRVSQEIESQLQYPRIPTPEEAGSGIVHVKFRCSPSGAADQATVMKSSGSGWLDQAALRAVKRLKNLHPLATGANPDQKYVALILFSTSPREHARQLAMINEEAKQRNAWFKGGTQTASIMLAPDES